MIKNQKPWLKKILQSNQAEIKSWPGWLRKEPTTEMKPKTAEKKITEEAEARKQRRLLCCPLCDAPVCEHSSETVEVLGWKVRFLKTPEGLVRPHWPKIGQTTLIKP